MAEFIISMLGFHWTVFIVFFSFLLFSSILLVHKYIKEYPIEYELSANLIEAVKNKFGNMKRIFCHQKRMFAVLENVILLGLFYSMLLWFPYYFMEIGYASDAINLSAITPFLMFFGCLGFEYLIKFCSNYAHWIISALLLLASICLLELHTLVGESNSFITVNHFFFLIFVCSLCLAGPLNTVFMTELSFLTADNKIASMYIFVVYAMLCRIFSMGSMFIIGEFLERSTPIVMQIKIPFLWFCSSMLSCWHWLMWFETFSSIGSRSTPKRKNCRSSSSKWRNLNDLEELNYRFYICELKYKLKNGSLFH